MKRLSIETQRELVRRLQTALSHIEGLVPDSHDVLKHMIRETLARARKEME